MIDFSGNRSDPLTVPVVIDSKPPSHLVVDGIPFGDNAISPADLLNPLVISGSTSSDTSVVQLDIFGKTFSSSPDTDGLWSIVWILLKCRLKTYRRRSLFQP